MLKKYYKWIIGIIILLLVIFSVVKYNKKQAFYEKIQSALQFGVYKEQTFNRIDIQTTNMVANRTDRDYLDSIVYVGLNELNLDSVAITIRQISPDVQARFDSESQLKAHIIGKENQYIIFVDEMSRDEAIKVLSHELIHLKQYYTKKLILEKDKVYWDGREIYQTEINETEYERRPWEAEAFAGQRGLENKIREILY
jgi:predicted metallopeptidase